MCLWVQFDEIGIAMPVESVGRARRQSHYFVFTLVSPLLLLISVQVLSILLRVYDLCVARFRRQLDEQIFTSIPNII